MIIKGEGCDFSQSASCNGWLNFFSPLFLKSFQTAAVCSNTSFSLLDPLDVKWLHMVLWMMLSNVSSELVRASKARTGTKKTQTGGGGWGVCVIIIKTKH